MADGKDWAAGILGMNVLGELRNLFVGLAGVQRMDRHGQRVESASLRRILVEMGKEEHILGGGWEDRLCQSS